MSNFQSFPNKRFFEFSGPVVLLLIFAGCAREGAEQQVTPESAASPPNILLIIADDMGVETLGVYGLGPKAPATATLDELANTGVRFDNFWSQPVCSPTRASVLSGRYGFRTGVGRALMNSPALPELLPKPEWASAEPPRVRFSRQIDPDERSAYLKPDEFTLPQAFKADSDLGYATAAIGKWHLGDVPNGWLDHPNLVGFDHFSGLMEGVTPTFYSWNKVVNGEVFSETGYTASDKIDDAVAWIGEQEDRPWFMWLAFNLPHPPLHLPPRELLQSDYSHLDPQANPNDSPLDTFYAMIEAMDTEIGRLLASLEPDVRDRTYVIFMGDNGSTPATVTAPFDRGRAKGTVYQGGVNVPLIVAGPGVRNGVSEALVNSTDIYFTVLEMAGIDPADVVPADVTTDSVSFRRSLEDPAAVSTRDWVYVDEFRDSESGRAEANYAMRNGRYKLLRHNGELQFYDLQDDPFEHNDLLAGSLSAQQQAEFESLQAQLTQLRISQ